ncbi:MAG: hypothetical protein HY240_02940 [Actinobacteria bacterium]|nr:hypothetical protein [Actinomycetota bacterium]
MKGTTMKLVLTTFALLLSGTACAAATASPASSPVTLVSPVIAPVGDYRLDPPPADVKPIISAADGVAQVHDPSVVTSVTLVLFTDLSMSAPDGSLRFDHVLAWDVERNGCWPVPGPSPVQGQDFSPRPCFTHDQYLVDATTGRMVEELQGWEQG